MLEEEPDLRVVGSFEGSRLMTKLDVEHLAALVKFPIRHGLTSA
jgi:hypothetical protein